MKACTGVIVDTGRLRNDCWICDVTVSVTHSRLATEYHSYKSLAHHVIYLFDKVSPRLLPLLVCTAWLLRVFFDP